MTDIFDAANREAAEFESVLEFDPTALANLSNGRTENLKPIGGAFYHNFLRIIALYQLAPNAAAWAFVAGQINQKSGLADAGVTTASDPETIMRLGQHHDKLFAEWRCRFSSHQELNDYLWLKGFKMMALLFKLAGENQSTLDFMQKGYQSLLSSVLTSAWTAFEAFATDLWIEAVNLKPKLAGNFIANWQAKAQDKSLTLMQISAYEFDLRSRMGTVLVETKKVNFLKFDDLRNAYTLAFGDAFKSLFRQFPGLAALEAIRHLFAHRGGKVDQKFLWKVSEFDSLKDSPVNSDLVLTGPFVRDQLEGVMKFSTALFELVDSEIATPETPGSVAS